MPSVAPFVSEFDEALVGGARRSGSQFELGLELLSADGHAVFNEPETVDDGIDRCSQNFQHQHPTRPPSIVK